MIRRWIKKLLKPKKRQQITNSTIYGPVHQINNVRGDIHL